MNGVTIIRPGQRLIVPCVRIVLPSMAVGGGWWNNDGSIPGCVAAYQPKGAASLANSYTNLANPGTYTAAPGVAPAWDIASGWIFNGSTQYLTTGITPVNDLTWSVIVRFSAASGSGAMIGANANSGGSTPFLLIQTNRNTSGVVAYWYGGTALQVSPAATNGVLGIAGNIAYRNGSAESGTITPGVGTFGAGSLSFGRLGLYNGFYWLGNIQAAAIYSVVLTSGQVSALTTRMSAL